MADDTIVKVVTIVVLGVILTASVITLGVVAIHTDRDLFRAEALTFGGVVLLAALGGISWFTLRRHRWHIAVDRNGKEEQQ